MSELLMGHSFTVDHGGLVKRVTKEFPHVCPGDACSVAEWLGEQVKRQDYERLRKDRRPSATRCG